MKLGENLTSEWQREPKSEALLTVLHRVKDGDRAAHQDLIQMAEDGSPLAMMHLGKFCLRGDYGFDKDRDGGRRWLTNAADKGSIEAGYALAHNFKISGETERAVRLYSRLGERGYAPAYFALGSLYLKQNGDPPDEAARQRAIPYFEQASRLGHLHSDVVLSWLKRGSHLDFLRSIPLRLRLAFAYYRKHRQNPSSDALRH